jgi:hypothetical protein
MPSNIDRYKNDLRLLIAKGDSLSDAIEIECFPAGEIEKIVKKHGSKYRKFVQSLPSFKNDYQAWYSEAKILVRQLLPDRLAAFVKALYAHEQWLDDRFTATLFRNEDFHVSSPLNEARMIQAFHFPELAQDIANILRLQVALITFVGEQKTALMLGG